MAKVNKAKLQGFNNLTKALSFNIYDICYAKTPRQRQGYIEYIDEVYNAKRLTAILTEVSEIIGAKILNIAHEDYDPQGASATLLIAEGPTANSELSTETLEPAPESMIAHLDKSHVSVHTYPESNPRSGISTFRADIDIATCGVISPLKALNFLLHSFDSDIVIMDYRVRGFTRDVVGKKLFIDHKINSIQNFIGRETRDRYHMIDVNVYQENIFHTRMLLKDFELDNYLFGVAEEDLGTKERAKIRSQLKREMNEIFYGQNTPKDANL